LPPEKPKLVVVGSINLDLVARCERLPRAGETVTGATFERVPGGKGANQAVAAARLGADVLMVGAVGDDALAAEAVAGLTAAGVAAGWKQKDAPTGVALIAVDRHGENTIVVAPGANASLAPDDVSLPDGYAALCQLEIPLGVVEYVEDNASEDFFLNAAPAVDGPVPAADVTIVNRYELDALRRRDGLIALTLGADGAVLLDGGEEVARAEAPKVAAVDGTAAGDAFTACLVVSLLEGLAHEDALRRACVAGALAASRFGAQPSLPTAAEVDALL
jgi:ribokinase